MIGSFSSLAVVPDLSSRDRWSAIHETISRWPDLEDFNREAIEHAVVTRERIDSTAVGRGIALSHGELKGLSSLLVAVGISRIGIEFAAVDGQPVHLLFVFATPPSHRTEYLQALAQICRMGRQGLLKRLWQEEFTPNTMTLLLHQLVNQPPQVT